MERLKRKCNSYLETRDYNFTKAKKRRKAIASDRRKYEKLEYKVFNIRILKSYLYGKLSLGIDPKNCFIDLHFLKMLEHYLYLMFYHENIQKLSYNEKLLCYLKAIVQRKGFDPRKWNYEYMIQISRVFY